MNCFCTNCGAKMNHDDRFCSICGHDVGCLPPPAHTEPVHMQYQPSAPVKRAKHKAALIIAITASALAAIALVVFFVVPLITGLDGAGPFDSVAYPAAVSIEGDNSAAGIIAKPSVFEAEKTVAIAGGVIAIDNEQSALNGLKIDVAEGSYDEDKVFTISSAQIVSHGFDKELKLISPLIHIDNGGGYSKDAMLLTVPCVVPENVIPVAFYYHEKEKKLEYIPVMDYDSKSVTIGLRHFSTPVIGYFEKTFIDDVSVIDTGFLPGVDDFSFTNIGSAITPRGNCFGESVAAIWYYRNLKESQGSLYGRFDNYGKSADINFATKAFQHDDVLAYRLASMSQFLFAVSEDTRIPDWKMSRWNAMRTSDQTRFDQLVALIKFAGPQVLLIQRLDEDKTLRNFHAIIAYRVEGNRIYVADPNNPGKKDRYVEIANGKFKPYSSSDNAQDLEAGNAVNYNVFSAFGETAMFDHNMMRQLWDDLEDRTVGDDRFPEVEVTLTAKIKTAQGDEEDEIITPGYCARSKDLTFVVDLPGDVSCSVWFTDLTADVVKISQTNGRYTVQLENEGGYIGILLLKDGEWYGFEWVPVGLSDISGIYNFSGTHETDIYSEEPFTDFQVRVEQTGADMKITFLDRSTVLTGTYDEATGTFVGRDRQEADDVFATTFWMFKDTVIVFDLSAQPVTAEGKLEGHDDNADFLKYFKVAFTLTKAADA